MLIDKISKLFATIMTRFTKINEKINDELEKFFEISRGSEIVYNYSSCLNFLYNHFNGPTKLFPDLYLLKFLEMFLCVKKECN